MNTITYPLSPDTLFKQIMYRVDPKLKKIIEDFDITVTPQPLFYSEWNLVANALYYLGRKTIYINTHNCYNLDDERLNATIAHEIGHHLDYLHYPNALFSRQTETVANIVGNMLFKSKTNYKLFNLRTNTYPRDDSNILFRCRNVRRFLILKGIIDARNSRNVPVKC